VNTAIGGSSLGGLAAFYAHFRRADLFGGAIAMSPSFWLGHARVLEWIDTQGTPWVSRVYVDCGAHEGRGGGMLKLAEQVSKKLEARGYGKDTLRFRADKRGTHSERDWRRRAPGALLWMYRDAGGRKR
jgi:predicted alpha/beta superfamily hydrolase